MDEEGFVYILGRLKRFAKIGGEMVSLSAVEEALAGAFPEYGLRFGVAVMARPDEEHGERLIAVTNEGKLTLAQVRQAVRGPRPWEPGSAARPQGAPGIAALGNRQGGPSPVGDHGMSERVELRVHGPAALPTLVYLPGLHGDWTLIGGFRKALAGRVRFAEMTYPRTLAWTLEDYAAGVEQAAAQQGLERGWLLGESFGSQVAWALAARKRFETQGVILAGGFARHPMHWAVCLAEGLCGSIPTGL